jgi:hypothetical protein
MPGKRPADFDKLNPWDFQTSGLIIAGAHDCVKPETMLE